MRVVREMLATIALTILAASRRPAVGLFGISRSVTRPGWARENWQSCFVLCVAARLGGQFRYITGEKTMSLGLILVIVLIVFLLGGFSGRFGGYGYGYGHSGVGVLGTILIIVVVLMLLGKI